MEKPDKTRRSNRYQRSHLPEDKLIGDLAQCIMEGAAEDTREESDPVDQYARDLKLRLFKDPRQFRNRFVRGYNALIEQLRSSKKS